MILIKKSKKKQLNYWQKLYNKIVVNKANKHRKVDRKVDRRVDRKVGRKVDRKRNRKVGRKRNS